MLVVDGAGGYQTAPRSLATAVSEAHLPLYVRSFDWTHGRGRWLADQLDQAHPRCQAQRLAAEIHLYRPPCPGLPVSVVAFSAGSAAALAAAESLPPDSLERLVLLAPAVSSGYDLRRALASARQGLDVFTSEHDFLRLGLATVVAGTADGKHQVAAGLHGFDSPSLSPADAALAGRLRQHPWDPCMAWTGNLGTHMGYCRPAYLRAYVLPLLTQSE